MSVTQVFKRVDNSNVHFVIMGGQYNYRMKGFGPYALLKCGKKTLLDYNISLIKDYYGSNNITLVTSFKSEDIIDKYSNIRIVECVKYPTIKEESRVAMNSITEENIVFIRGNVMFPKIPGLCSNFGNYIMLCDNQDCDFSVLEENDRCSRLSFHNNEWKFPYCWTVNKTAKTKFRKYLNNGSNEIIIELLNQLFKTVSYKTIKTEMKVFLSKKDLECVS